MTTADHNHYFIELSESFDEPLSSGAAASLRTERARAFIDGLCDWLDMEDLTGELSALRVTALGHIMLTCTPALIAQVQAADWPDIAAVTSPAYVALPPLGSESRSA